MAIHNEFLNIHPYIHIYHCQVCICCFYCLEGYNCILWTKIDKWLSHSRSITSSTLHFWIIVPVWLFFDQKFLCRYALFYHSYLQKSGRSCRYIPKNFQVCTLIRIGTLIWKCGRLQLSVESCGDFSPVNKTLPNLPTNSKKPWNYNGTIIFEIDVIN